MLRPVKSHFIRPRVMGYFMTNAGTPSITDGCKDDITSVTDNSTGNSTLNFYEPFQRTSIPLITPAGGTGAIGNIVTAAAASARVLTSNEAGTAADVNAHVMVFGFDSAETKSISPSSSIVKAGRFRPRIIGLTFNSAGTLTAGKYVATCAKSATSTYTITLGRPFATAPVVVGSVTGSTAGVVRVTTSAKNQVVVDTFNDAGAATANGAHLFILGWDSYEYGRAHRIELQAPQLKPRLNVYEITVSAGVPGITIGTGSVSDDNTGLFTITYTTPFKRAPQVVAVGDGTTISTVVSTSTTTTQVKTYNNAGAAADAGKVYVVALGYDYADEC